MKYVIRLVDVSQPSSHPSRGAWIEIKIGVRILKMVSVAPLTGCVD